MFLFPSPNTILFSLLMVLAIWVFSFNMFYGFSFHGVLQQERGISQGF